MGARHTLLFSATYPADIQKIAQPQHSYKCHSWKRETDEILKPDKTMQSMVFVENKKTTDFIASYLCQTDHAATSIHGDRLQPKYS